MAQLRLIALEKRYGDAAAVRGIDATIEDGELLALLGPSGCGKTTTLQMLAGFLKPDAGEIWAADRLISSAHAVVPPERRNMAMVFQGYALWPHMNVADNVAFGLQMRRLSRDDIRQQMDWVLGIVNLRGMEGRFPHELSGGQQQRVALARALVVRPGTLLLDEPLSNLDANLREQMRFEIRRVHEQTGITMVYVTHDQAEALVIADRIAVMNAGKLEQVGTPREIYEAPQSRFAATFIGQANCLPAQVIGPGIVAVDGAHFAVANTWPADEQNLTLTIRPSAVNIIASDAEAPATNTIVGRLVRQAYLGDQQDLRFEVSDGLAVRVLARAGTSAEPGADTILHFPPQHCRVVRT